MISSMTAFAREQLNSDVGSLAVEIRSVNHRYLDLSFKLPETLRELEAEWRDQCRRTLRRGKVEISLRLAAGPPAQSGLTVDSSLASQVVAAALKIQSDIPNAAGVNPMDILRWPGVICEPENSDEQLLAQSHSLFGCALESLADARNREGERLAVVLLDNADKIERIVGTCRQQLPGLLEAQRSRLLSRLAELSADPDQDRIEQELVHMAQRADVAEELDRLNAHLAEIRDILEQGGPCGRRLDFLMQELNREANTLSSKATATPTTMNAVELKVLVEQMREQIQNIE
jgi:uncharacterized protein (TIGR00255 family)